MPNFSYSPIWHLSCSAACGTAQKTTLNVALKITGMTPLYQALLSQKSDFRSELVRKSFDLSRLRWKIRQKCADSLAHPGGRSPSGSAESGDFSGVTSICGIRACSVIRRAQSEPKYRSAGRLFVFLKMNGSRCKRNQQQSLGFCGKKDDGQPCLRRISLRLSSRQANPYLALKTCGQGAFRPA